MLPKNEMQATTGIILNRRKFTALVDTGRMHTLVSRFMCHSWMPREVNVLTADGKTLKYYEQGLVKLGIDITESVNIGALVVDRQLLGCDRILGIDAIRMAVGITIMPTGVVSFFKIARS